MGLIARRWAYQSHRGLLEELETAVTWGEDRAVVTLSAPSLSGWGVREHLEHLWRSDKTIVSWLHEVRDGTAKTDGRSSTLSGLVVLWSGRIPRGRGRAPQITQPASSEITDVVAGLRAIRDEVASLDEALPHLASATVARRHPLLGSFTPAEWLRFAHIHHVHHRRIIEEIRSLAQTSAA